MFGKMDKFGFKKADSGFVTAPGHGRPAKSEHKGDNLQKLVTPEQRQLLDYLEDLWWGEARVVVRAGKPVVVARGHQDL